MGRTTDQTKRGRLSLALLLSLSLVGMAGAANGSTSNGKGDGGGEGSGPFTGLAQSPDANLFNGAMTTAVPILIPPGRKHTTPALNLTYSSNGGASPFGFGWSLPLGTVSRSTKNGIPRCEPPYLQDFVLQLPTGSVELFFVDTVVGGMETYDLYRARTDEAYLEARANTMSNFWKVFDRRGLTYTFGDVATAKAFVGSDTFLNAATCEFTTRWELTQIEDPNGNRIDITYLKDGNTSYPSTIEYGANPAAGLSLHPFRVSFSGPEDPANARLHPRVSYQSAVKTELNYLITSIAVKYKPDDQASSFSTIRTYTLSHTESNETGRALLAQIAGTDLPAQTFEYADEDFGAVGEEGAVSGGPSGDLRQWDLDDVERSLLDLNGDGFVDLVVADNGNSSSWDVYYGGTSGISGTASTWNLDGGMPVQAQTTVQDSADGWVRRDTVDITGDGVPDYVDSAVGVDGGSFPWRVFPGYCDVDASGAPICGFGAQETWNAPVLVASPEPYLGYTDTAYPSYTRRQLIDMNADGRPDLVEVMATGDFNKTVIGWNIYTNTGDNAFDAMPVPFAANVPLGTSQDRESSNIFDFNGDGLPDLVQKPGGEAGIVWASINPDGSIAAVSPSESAEEICADVAPDGPGSWEICPGFVPPGGGAAPVIEVRLNTGRGFEAEPRYSAIPYVSSIDPYLVYYNGGIVASTHQGIHPSQIYTRIHMCESTPTCYPERDMSFADFLDVNGDGLPDFVYIPHPTDAFHGGSSEWHVVLNTGDGYLENLFVNGPPGSLNMGNVIAPRVWSGFNDAIRKRTTGDTVEIDVVDWNGDGVLDLVEGGATWTVTTNGQVPGEEPPVRPGLLVRAHNGLGGTTDVRYGASTQFEHLDDETQAPTLPMVAWVTTGIRRSDGLCDVPLDEDGDPIEGDLLFNPAVNTCIGEGHELIQTIEYEDGRFDPESREFRGFRMVMVTDGEGNTTDTEFNQADHTRGKIDKQMICAGHCSTGSVVREDTYLWTTKSSSLPNDTDRTQVYLAEHQRQIFDLVPTETLDQCLLHRNEPPDDYGRNSVRCTLACAGAPPVEDSCSTLVVDEQVDTLTTWADPNGESQVRDKPENVVTRYKPVGGAQVTLTEQWFQYDGDATPLSAGQVEEGNVRWVTSRWDTVSAGPAPSSYPRVETSYDGFGNVTQVIDPRGNVSTSVFAASSFHLYPSQEIRPATNGGTTTHETDIVTDLRFGKPTQITDVNEQVSEFAYDTLGRPLCEAQPGHSCTPGQQFTAEYEYAWGIPGGGSFEDKLTRVTVRTREPNATLGYLESESLSDALGRPRVGKTQRVIGSTPSLQTVIGGQRDYDGAGRAAETFAPYVAASASDPPPASTASTTFDYALNGGPNSDPLGRVHIETPPDLNATTTFYEGRQRRVVNAKGGEVRTLADHFGRVVRKELYDGAALEMWFDYVMDGAGRILSTTVSGDSTTTVTTEHDELGRGIRTIDPDSGTWLSRHDASGNLIFQDDPRANQHVEFVYDEHDRLLERCVFDDDTYAGDACASASVSESRFTYDDTTPGNRGIGRLTSVTDLTGNTSFRYDDRTSSPTTRPRAFRRFSTRIRDSTTPSWVNS